LEVQERGTMYVDKKLMFRLEILYFGNKGYQDKNLQANEPSKQ